MEKGSMYTLKLLVLYSMEKKTMWIWNKCGRVYQNSPHLFSGLEDLFTAPNLCGIFPGDSESFISDARHSAFFSMTETGVEAAAATSISFSRSLSVFSALQPFVLILWSDEAGAPLFMGRIVDVSS